MIHYVHAAHTHKSQCYLSCWGAVSGLIVIAVAAACYDEPGFCFFSSLLIIRRHDISHLFMKPMSRQILGHIISLGHHIRTYFVKNWRRKSNDISDRPAS